MTKQKGTHMAQQSEAYITETVQPAFAATGINGYEVASKQVVIDPGTVVSVEVQCPTGKNAVGAGWRQTKVPLERLGLWQSGPSDDMAGWVFSAANEGTKQTTVQLYVICAVGGLPVFGGAAPVATAVAGKNATVAFQTPAGQDQTVDPWDYEVTKTTGGSDSPAEVENSSVAGNTTTLTVKGLITGTEYTFKVTATGTYDARAISRPSNLIKAVA